MGRAEAICAGCQAPISAAPIGGGAWVDRRGIATCPRGGWHRPGGAQLTAELQADVFGPHAPLILQMTVCHESFHSIGRNRG